MRRLVLLLAVLSLTLAACRSGSTPSLALGAEAPSFELPGVDGKVHKLADYSASQILAVVFTCNHCPESQLYEGRIQRIFEEYRGKGVALVAINPNNADAISPGALRYSDVGDSLADMKERAKHRKLEYPYLYDGDTQNVSKAFKVAATPQIFVFDRDRKLRYQGRIDDNVRESGVKARDARNAIDALLGGRAVPTAQTVAAGCPPVWRDAAPTPQQTQASVTEPITVTPAGPELLKKVRANDTGKLMLVNFWATWCGPCAVEFPDLVMTHRMYKDRPFQLVTISENSPTEEPAVIAFLKRQQAGGRHLLFASDRLYELQAAFDPAMPAPVPFTLVIAPNGDVVYQELGSLDTLKMRRAVLANLPDDPAHPGMQAHWAME
jgi:thiol-disulfide isomerase/thioredoxin